MTNVKLGETRHLDIPVSSATGAAVDADSAPTVKVFEDDNDTPILSLTATKRTSLTGKYRRQVDFTGGNGFEVGKSYNVYADATVAGVAAHTLLGRFVVRATSIDDAAPAATALSTAQWSNGRAANLDNLDAAVTSRAAAATALSTAQWTNGRAALLDFLDAAISGRAPAATALSTAQWTNVRAGLLDNLDALISSRLAAAGYTAPDNANIVVAALQATALVARLGAFTGTGTSTVQDWLRAVMRKDLAAPADVGGTFATATDSLEAIREKADTISGGGGGAAMPRQIKSRDRTVRA